MKTWIPGLLLLASLAVAGCGGGSGGTVLGNNQGTAATGGGGGGGACNGTIVDVAVVADPGDATQGFAFQFTDAVDTNAQTNTLTAVDPGGSVAGGAGGAQGETNSMQITVNVTDAATFILVVNAAPGSGLAQGQRIPIVNGAPPQGVTRFATLNMTQQVQGGLGSWLGSGGEVVLDAFTAPNGGDGTVTASLEGVCLSPLQGSNATGTLTVNGAITSPLQAVGNN